MIRLDGMTAAQCADFALRVELEAASTACPERRRHLETLAASVWATAEQRLPR